MHVLNRFAQMSEENSAHVRQSVETAEFMAELSRSLNASLGRFRVVAQTQ